MKFLDIAAIIVRPGRTPRGVRGLKFQQAQETANKMHGRTPRGVRGLKCLGVGAGVVHHESHPSRGAWIEIRGGEVIGGGAVVAPLAGCVD